MRQIAIDTNVLVRLFVDDDLVQRDKALELLESADSVIVPTTVFLECVWVLTRSYKMEKNLVLQQLRSFSESIPNLVIQEDELGERGLQLWKTMAILPTESTSFWDA